MRVIPATAVAVAGFAAAAAALAVSSPVTVSGSSPVASCSVPAVGGTNYPMTYDATANVWNTTTTIPLAPGAGPVPVTLNWEEQQGTLASKGGCTRRRSTACAH